MYVISIFVHACVVCALPGLFVIVVVVVAAASIVNIPVATRPGSAIDHSPWRSTALDAPLPKSIAETIVFAVVSSVVFAVVRLAPDVVCLGVAVVFLIASGVSITVSFLLIVRNRGSSDISSGASVFTSIRLAVCLASVVSIAYIV